VDNQTNARVVFGCSEINPFAVGRVTSITRFIYKHHVHAVAMPSGAKILAQTTITKILQTSTVKPCIA
jgi:hypothetical protein